MLGEMVKKWVGQGLSSVQLFVHTMVFNEKNISKVEESLSFSMLAS